MSYLGCDSGSASLSSSTVRSSRMSPSMTTVWLPLSTFMTRARFLTSLEKRNLRISLRRPGSISQIVASSVLLLVDITLFLLLCWTVFFQVSGRSIRNVVIDTKSELSRIYACYDKRFFLSKLDWPVITLSTLDTCWSPSWACRCCTESTRMLAQSLNTWSDCFIVCLLALICCALLLQCFEL